jgi:hypothetical protein
MKPENQENGKVVQSIDSRSISTAEKLTKEKTMQISDKPGRRLKFNPPKTRKGKASFLALSLGGFLIVALVLVSLLAKGGGDPGSVIGAKKTTEDKSATDRNLPDNNNSSGYLQSPPANFNGSKLDLSFELPRMMVSKQDTASLKQQVSWQNGFAVMVVGVDRDYRPISEFSHKRIAQSGDELVRVNFLVGNATLYNIPVGYDDLSLYAKLADGTTVESERIDEDTYSTKNGQVLGGKQIRKVSMHYRLKRGSIFSIFRSKQFQQDEAEEDKGEERNPTLSLTINL